jgi:organic hydroperoxide reductase OsmC/OhrA
MTGAVHTYRALTSWSGSTAGGFDAYDRAHRSECPPAGQTLTLSADPAFRGDPALLNPEQLLLAAASSCQMLTFLAVVARARIDVISYEDDASAIMPDDDKPVRITVITLRPKITVRGDAGDDRIRHLIDVAHGACFVANSLKSEIIIEPAIVRA